MMSSFRLAFLSVPVFLIENVAFVEFDVVFAVVFGI
jgi:hypothetical protein